MNGEKHKYMFMYNEQNSGKNHNIKTGDKTFEYVNNPNKSELHS